MITPLNLSGLCQRITPAETSVQNQMVCLVNQERLISLAFRTSKECSNGVFVTFLWFKRHQIPSSWFQWTSLNKNNTFISVGLPWLPQPSANVKLKKGINNYIYLIYLKALVEINPDNKDETYKDFYNV